MNVRKVWSSTGTGSDVSSGIAGREPSHIHLPRRRRVVRPDDQGTRVVWPEEDSRGQAPPAGDDA